MRTNLALKRFLHEPETVPVGTSATQRLGSSPLDLIGNTPLLRLDYIGAKFPQVKILCKAEWLNPGGSVKDRAAANIVREAFRKGQLGDGKSLLDASSGNTGIAYAMMGAVYGFPVTL